MYDWRSKPDVSDLPVYHWAEGCGPIGTRVPCLWITGIDNDIDKDTVSHLFECTASPTTLTVSSLWLYPLDVATFLSSLDFPDLPPLPPPPSEPPPSPPSSPDSALFSPLSLGQSFFYSSISSSNGSLNTSPTEVDIFLADH